VAHGGRPPSDGTSVVAINADERGALLRTIAFLVDTGGDLEWSYHRSEVDDFARYRERVEVGFGLLDDLAWGEPDRSRYTVRVTPAARRVLAWCREQTKGVLAEDRQALDRVDVGDNQYVYGGMTLDQSAAYTRGEIDRELDELHALNAVLG
jgi:hypothetical protein